MSSGRRVLTAEEFFICKLPREWVSLPELKPADSNGDDPGVYVTTLDTRAKELWQHDVTQGTGKVAAGKLGSVKASALSRACVNEDGNPIFTTEQIDQISSVACTATDRLWEVYERLNVTNDAAVREAVKN